MIGLLIAAAAAIVICVVAPILAIGSWRRISRLEALVQDLAARLDALQGPRTAARATAAEAPIQRATQPAAAQVPPPSLDIRPPTPRPPIERQPVVPSVVAPAAPPPAPSMKTPVPAAAAPPMPPAAAATEVPAPALDDAAAGDSLETRIGSRWLLYAGVIAIVVGVSYFEKLAFDNRWIGETARVVQGAIAGFVLVGLGLRFVRAGYRLYGQMISGCGVAVLYVSIYAAFGFYDLIGRPAAFVLMCAVTALAAWLADRQRSQGLALMAVGGGFATPFLLASGADAQITLFTYDAILIAGTMFLAHRREWPALNVVTYAFTLLTLGAWATVHYTSSKYLTMELFLTLYCGMYLYILRQSRGWEDPLAAAARAVLWTAPLLYYLYSLAILASHSAALLVFLVLLALAGALVSSRAGSRTRLALWLAVAVPLVLWSDARGGAAWLTPGLTAAVAVYAITLAAHLEAGLRDHYRFAGEDVALVHLNGLATYATAYLLIQPVRAGAAGPVAAAFALWQIVLAYALARRQREQALHHVALAFTLLTVAAALAFDGLFVTAAWAAEGTALLVLGLRERRTWLRIGGLLLFAVAVTRLAGVQFSDPPVDQLLFLNGRAATSAFLIALTWALAWIHHRRGDPARRDVETGAALVAAKLLLLALAASEIVAYWKIHAAPPFEPASQVAMAWLITGAAMVWLGLVRRQEWVRRIGAAVVAGGMLGVLSAQLQAAPVGYVVFLNGRAAAGALAVALLYGLAVLHRRIGAHLTDLPFSQALLLTAASLFTLSLLTSEIDAYWSARGAADLWSTAREGLKTIVWAATGSLLVRLGLTSGRGWVRAIGATVFALALVRLLRLELAGVPPPYVVGANARVMAALVAIALSYGLAALYRRARDLPDARFQPRTVLFFTANLLTLLLLTSEITAYWNIQGAGTAAASSAQAASHFAREVMLSVTWAVYATALVVVGLRRRYAPIRYFAIGLFLVTIAKVLAVDLATLGQIYRVLSVVALGVALLVASFLYQRFRNRLWQPAARS